MNEAIENYKNSSDKQRKSITDYFSLKRLSAASLFMHNHFNRNQNSNISINQLDPKLNREGSNSSLDKNSLSMNIMKNTDQLKLIRTLSQISNLSNYEYDPVKGGYVTATKNDDKLEKARVNYKTPSIPPIEGEPLVDFERMRGVSLNSRDRDLSWINGTRNYSKRNSLISNISLLFRREDNKEEQ
jgi:hypothetical protein